MTTSTSHPRNAGQRVKVLYVAGFERSGSTIFAKFLGESDGAFAAGNAGGESFESHRNRLSLRAPDGLNILWSPSRGLVSFAPAAQGR